MYPFHISIWINSIHSSHEHLNIYLFNIYDQLRSDLCGRQFSESIKLQNASGRLFLDRLQTWNCWSCISSASLRKCTIQRTLSIWDKIYYPSSNIYYHPRNEPPPYWVPVAVETRLHKFETVAIHHEDVCVFITLFTRPSGPQPHYQEWWIASCFALSPHLLSPLISGGRWDKATGSCDGA